MSKSITLKKLNGINYLAWAHAVNIVLQVKQLLKYLRDNLSDKKDPTYENWMSQVSFFYGMVVA